MRYLVVFLSVISFSVLTNAQKQKVVGVVQNSNVEYLAGVELLLFYGDDTSVVAQTKSNEAGEFILEAHQGHYELKASKEGYSATYRPVIINLPQDQNVGVIQLQEVVKESKEPRGCIFGRKKKGRPLPESSGH